MMFFVVNEGDNIWLNVLIIGLFEIPCLFIVATLVEYGPRKVLYWMIYLTSGISAGAIFFTHEGQGYTWRYCLIVGKIANDASESSW